MASGPEHYKESERLLGVAAASEDAPMAMSLMLVEAQVHATLAQAAAIALSVPVDDQPPEDAKAWFKVAGSTTLPEDVVEAEILEADEDQDAEKWAEWLDDGPF